MVIYFGEFSALLVYIKQKLNFFFFFYWLWGCNTKCKEKKDPLIFPIQRTCLFSVRAIYQQTQSPDFSLLKLIGKPATLLKCRVEYNIVTRYCLGKELFL